MKIEGVCNPQGDLNQLQDEGGNLIILCNVVTVPPSLSTLTFPADFNNRYRWIIKIIVTNAPCATQQSGLKQLDSKIFTILMKLSHKLSRQSSDL